MDARTLLSERLAAGEVVLVDGGMGTELQARGVPMDRAAWSALANVDRPELVQAIHEDYIRAGADVIIANTYPVSRMLLRGSGADHRFPEITRAGVEAAMRARDSAGRPGVAVAGSVSLGVAVDFMQHTSPPLTGQALEDACREEVALLVELGVDVVVLEMIMSPSYGVELVDAALATGAPVWLGISVALDDEGRVVSLDDRIPVDELLDDLVRPQLQAVTVMHSRMAATEPALDAVARHFDGPRGAYPESGDWTPPNWVFSSLTPSEFAAAAAGWVARGKAQIVGGCCGTSPPFIEALAEELTRTER
ncbi:MAG: homocysteine S-methyltransferase family protein [Acidimicrobiales bacterium]